jgi:hypothetical protein
MKNICFYTSDYGFGHAARDIALIRKIAEECGAKIFVKTDLPLDFMRESIPFATAIRQKNDIGIVFKGGGVVLDETENVLDQWVDSWDEYILAEKRFCEENKIDLILSDIVPQPFLVADDLGLPSIGISNFTWHYIFYNLFGRTSATEMLEGAYRAGDTALVLPFNEKMDLFRRRKEISLVSREITVERCQLRNKFGIKDEDTLIFLGIGRSLDKSLLKDLKEMDLTDVKLLVSSGIELPAGSSIQIPANETETQNYIAMCDLVVSKAGYSTVSEVLRAEIPMFLFRREGYEEDTIITREVEAQGIGKEISERSFLAGDWLEMMEELQSYKEAYDSLDDRFKEDGAFEVLSAVEEVIL